MPSLRQRSHGPSIVPTLLPGFSFFDLPSYWHFTFDEWQASQAPMIFHIKITFTTPPEKKVHLKRQKVSYEPTFMEMHPLQCIQHPRNVKDTFSAF